MDDQIARMRKLLRQWRRAYLDDIDDYEAFNRATDDTTRLLGDRHPFDYDADPTLPVENTPDSASLDQSEK